MVSVKFTLGKFCKKKHLKIFKKSDSFYENISLPYKSWVHSLQQVGNSDDDTNWDAARLTVVFCLFSLRTDRALLQLNKIVQS